MEDPRRQYNPNISDSGIVKIFVLFTEFCEFVFEWVQISLTQEGFESLRI